MATRLEYELHPAISRWRFGTAGGRARGELTDTWAAQLERDPDLREVVVCLELVLGDKAVRIATKPIHTESERLGHVFQWHAGLEDVELVWEYEPGTAGSSARTMGVTLPNELVDCAALVRQARILGGVAEVSLQVDGMDYDERLVLMRGDLTDVEYDAREQTVSCTVQDPLDTCDLHLPPYTLTADRFSAIPDASVGATLAVVLPEYAAIPCYFIDKGTSTPTVVVCHGHLTVDTVYVEDAGQYVGSTDPTWGWSEVHGMDKLGQPYTGIKFTGSATWSGEGTEKVYASISGGPTSEQPIPIVRHVVEQHTTLGRAGANPWLFGRAEARTGYLAARACANASGSSNVKALEFVEGTFLADFPMISMVWHGGGYGPVVTDRRDRFPVRQLVADQHPLLDRASSVRETAKSECFNTFSIQYDYDPVEDSYAGYAERTPSNSALCELSRRLVGERHADTIESLWVTDEGTANKIMDWLVDHQTLPALDVEYDCSPGLIIQLVLADNVALTDPDFLWVEAVATVRRLVYTPAKGELGLRVWNDAVELGGGAYSGGVATGSAAQFQG